MSPSAQSDVVEVRAHGLTWRCAADFAAELPDLPLERLRSPDGLAEGELVKRSTTRTVARLDRPGRPAGPGLYVKHVRVNGFLRRLLHVLRPTQAAREWRMGQALRRVGIPTCRILAAAERRRCLLPAETFLVCEEIPRVVKVRQYLAGDDWRRAPAAERRALLEEGAQLTASLVRAGLHHRDLHTSNIVIDARAPAGRRLHVLDLHRIGRAAGRRRALMQTLVFLADSTRDTDLSLRERLHFLRRALEGAFGAAAVTPAATSAWARRLLRCRRAHHRRHMRSRTRRCLAASSEFTPDLTGDHRLHRLREFPAAEAEEAAALHERALAGDASAGLVRKNGPRTCVTICTLAGGRSVCVKSYLRAGRRERLKDLLRRSVGAGRARSAWIAHRGLLVRGLPAARGLVLMEARRVLEGRPDYLVVEALPAEGSLGELSGRNRTGSLERALPAPSGEAARRLTAAVAGLFRLLAAQEVRHPDLKPSNILAGDTKGQPRLWLVDLDRVRFDWPWIIGDWIHHLAQCDSSLGLRAGPVTRMRCLRLCGRGRWSPGLRLRLARAVRRASLDRNPAWLSEIRQAESDA